MFPSGYFYLVCRKNGYALDVYDGSTKTGANIIIWPQKFADSDNQLWSYDQGRLVNKKSGYVMDIQSGAFKKDKTIIQNKRKDKHQTQEWDFDNGFIFSIVYPTMVLEIKSEDGGAQVLLTHRKNADNLSQKWFIEPYHQFETSLNMAADVGPLHKRSNFGVPRLGYGAELGVPAELTALPPNIKVVGVPGVVSKPTVYISPTAYNRDPQQSNYPAPSINYTAPQAGQAQHNYQTSTVPTPPQPPVYGATSVHHSSGVGSYHPSNPPVSHGGVSYSQSNPPFSSSYQHPAATNAGYPPNPTDSTATNYPPAPITTAGHSMHPILQSPSGTYHTYSPTFASVSQQSAPYPAYSSSPPSYGGGGSYQPQTQAGYPSPPAKHNTNTYPPSAGSGGYSSPPKSNPVVAGYGGSHHFTHQQSVGYPPAPSHNTSGYPPVSAAGGAAYPLQQPGSGYPPHQPGVGYPPQQPGGEYPQQQPVGGFFSPHLPQRQQTGMPEPESGYPPANYPPYPPN
ncbi:hypothetical protein BX666DRAFT_39199 [Dichotomocladium elegans]|nr:hypothetical protein BX666DRAFT_39199 [Dichotomocladium elegans]